MENSNISSAQYQRNIKDTDNIAIKITINGKIYSVPLDPDNTDYQAILEWAEIDGNTIEEAD